VRCLPIMSSKKEFCEWEHARGHRILKYQKEMNEKQTCERHARTKAREREGGRRRETDTPGGLVGLAGGCRGFGATTTIGWMTLLSPTHIFLNDFTLVNSLDNKNLSEYLTVIISFATVNSLALKCNDCTPLASRLCYTRSTPRYNYY
jgi:hypothetical protein